MKKQLLKFVCPKCNSNALEELQEWAHRCPVSGISKTPKKDLLYSTEFALHRCRLDTTPTWQCASCEYKWYSLEVLEAEALVPVNDVKDYTIAGHCVVARMMTYPGTLYETILDGEVQSWRYNSVTDFFERVTLSNVSGEPTHIQTGGFYPNMIAANWRAL